MKTAYVVTSGEYSDYSICAVFDSRELAEAMVAGREGYMIEEYTINPGEHQYREGQRKWLIKMRGDGSLVEALDLGWAWVSTDIEPPRIHGESEWKPGGPTVIVGWMLNRELWAKSEEQAVKSTNELRAQWIADGKWDDEVVTARNGYGKWAHFAPGI